MRKYDKLIFEVSKPGHVGYTLVDEEFSKVDYIMPGSYKELCTVFNHVVAHIVALKLSED